MVFFTCNACGESVKKIQVEKHVSVCRNCECLSCIDCGKDFWGDDYKNHVKCISEDQKYGGKGYEGKAHKGDVKQQAWIQKINELIKKPNVSPKVRELLKQISAFDNVPRKKAKFQNWMKNSLKVHNESILEQVWNIFSEASSSELVSKGQDQQPPNQVAKSRSEASTKVPTSSKANDSTEKESEAKKNKRERKEERQKNRKREKKELKLENHQDNSKSQKLKKRKKGQVAEVEAEGHKASKANGSAVKKGKKKRGQGKQAREEDANGVGGPQEDPSKVEMKTAVGRRKRKLSIAETDSKMKKRKFPEQSEAGEPEDDEAPTKGKFNWKGTIKAVLRQAPEGELSIKKLRKKVLAQYYTVTNDRHRCEEELLVIFNKKVSKNPTFKLIKDKVKLLK
ncbi:Cell growth-regulating nucleolar protein [Sciurus carolinensis]|uniref:Cell growth-regulating nucleolar protein n=1 Tax=Sciurus carolinensis TaxID=30640 RepID=A0AA41MRW1_SCICA|nr:cell growth-regulating nucleolar protein isoform X1 [Sciurus carolinensis]MBZ3877015.1 Cell growth-regulating nucleolar protein [Sciurus carolinensis]